MKALALSRAAAAQRDLERLVMCHDLRDAAGKVAVDKGQMLDGPAASRLLALAWDEIHVLEMEPGDLHEEPAGGRLSAAAAGPGVEVKGYANGQWTLTATRRGLLEVRRDALAHVNALAGMSVFTLWDLQPVEAGEVVARAKITPLAMPEALVKQAEERAWGAGGLVAVRAFSPAVLGAVSRENLEPRQRQRFETSLAEKAAWLGSRLLPARYAAPDPDSVAAELEALLGEGASILIAAGAGSLDPLDPMFVALDRLGARMERHGAPAHPGSLLWLSEVSGRPVLGMPACGMFSQATTFDLVLPRILAGHRVDNAVLAALGHGGLLSRDSAYRFPPYRKSGARGEIGE